MQLLNLIQGAEVEWKNITEVFKIRNGYTPSKKNLDFWDENLATIPWFRMEDIRTNGHILSDSIQHITEKAVKGNLFKANSIIIATSATIGEHALITVDFMCNQRFTCFTISDEYEDKLLPKFAYYYFFSIDKFVQQTQKQSSMPAADMEALKKLEIPIPSLEIQQKVIEILDKMTDYVKELTAELTAELTLRQKQYAYYRAQLLTFDAEGYPLRDSGESLTVRWTTLGEIATIIAGGDLPKDYRKGQTEPSSEFPYPIYSNGTGVQSLYGFTDDFRVDSEAITISARGTLGWHTIREPKFTPIVRLLTLIPNTEIISTKFLNYVLTQVKLGGVKTGIPSLTKPMIEKVSIPVPPLKFQSKIVEILDKFQALIEDVSGLLPEEIASRQKQYEYWREQLLSFKKE